MTIIRSEGYSSIRETNTLRDEPVARTHPLPKYFDTVIN